MKIFKPKLSDFLLDLHQSLAHQGLAKSLDISIDMPTLFANLAASISRHISSQKIAQLRLKKNGFTLIEILIAIFILTTVLTTVYAAYTGTFRIIKDTRRGDNIYSMARTAMNIMARDMESVCGYRDSFKFASAEIEKEDFVELSFLSSAHLDFEDERSSGVAFINYYVVEDNEKDSCILKRKDELYRDKAEDADKDALKKGGYILCEGLQSLTYKFYDSSGEEYDSWDSESELKTQKDSAPSAVSIHMDFINPDNEDMPYRFMTKVFLPTAGE
ncbi:MAG: prepilin-type N-terminal cleavage/methylation domain-containing protein [Thermodesulfobacteriota bacterium]|nr:prepilin-type N-terminal cleavage/methylation domain-containing protein [Thermodesulfobacteriota bacterium]